MKIKPQIDKKTPTQSDREDGELSEGEVGGIEDTDKMDDEPAHHPKITVESPKSQKPEFESKLSTEMDPNLPHMLGPQMAGKKNKNRRANSKKKGKSTDR